MAFERCLTDRWLPMAGYPLSPVEACSLCIISDRVCARCPLVLIGESREECTGTPYGNAFHTRLNCFDLSEYVEIPKMKGMEPLLVDVRSFELAIEEASEAAWEEVWFLIGAMRKWEETE